MDCFYQSFNHILTYRSLCILFLIQVVSIVGAGSVKFGAKDKETITRMELRVRESRHHLIQRLFESVGLTVLRASRKSFGPVLLGSMKRGDFRYLTPNEVKALKRGVNTVGEKKNKKLR